MSRSGWSRATATLLLLWFAVVQAMPVVLHSCPMHDGGGGHDGHHATMAGAERVQGAAGMSHMRGMAGHRDAMPDDAAARLAMAPAGPRTTHDHGGSNGHGPCTCLGYCACCTASADVPSHEFVLPTVAVHTVHATVFQSPSWSRSRDAHVLPYANGPPVA